MSKAPDGAEGVPQKPSWASAFVKKRSPWKETEEVAYEAPSGGHLICQRAVPVHVPTHACCFVIYVGLLTAYLAYSIIMWALEEPVTTFSSVPSEDFGPVPVTVTVDCKGCNTHAKFQRFWAVIYAYEGLEHCSSVTPATVEDANVTSAVLCRSSDDITDGTGIRVRLDNVSQGARKTVGRPSVLIQEGDFSVLTPLEFWHEKTVLLGLAVHRDDEECLAVGECKNFRRGLFLQSMQYDGFVNWGDDTNDVWAGAQLNVRMLSYAQVYTTHSRPITDVLADAGGASALLVVVLGALRKVVELLSTRESGRKDLAIAGAGAAGIVVGAAVEVAGLGERFDGVADCARSGVEGQVATRVKAPCGRTQVPVPSGRLEHLER